MTRTDQPPEGLRLRLLATATQSPSPGPNAWRRRLAFCGLSAAAWLSVAVVASGIRRDWSELPPVSVATTLGALLTVASLACTAGLARGRAMVGATTESLLVSLWGLLIVLHALVLLISPRGPSTSTFPGFGATISHAAPHFLRTTVVALPLIALPLVILRGLILARPALAGACLGLGAATWAHAVVWLHCPIGGPGHALIGHVLPALPLMLAGAWVMRAADQRWLRGGGDTAVRTPRGPTP